MTPEYQVQRLDGYTDGKPSWCKVFVPWHQLRTKEFARQACEDLQCDHPNTQYRVRKVSKRGRK